MISPVFALVRDTKNGGQSTLARDWGLGDKNWMRGRTMTEADY